MPRSFYCLVILSFSSIFFNIISPFPHNFSVTSDLIEKLSSPLKFSLELELSSWRSNNSPGAGGLWGCQRLCFFASLKVGQEIRFGNSILETTAQMKKYSSAFTPGHILGDSTGKCWLAQMPPSTLGHRSSHS